MVRNSAFSHIRIKSGLFVLVALGTLSAAQPAVSEKYGWQDIDSLKVENFYDPFRQEQLDKIGPLPVGNLGKTKLLITTPDGPGPFPAVVIMHGCGGWGMPSRPHEANV